MRARAEEALRAAHEKLSGWVSELEQRHRDLALLNDMGDLLHACVTVENAYAVIRQFAPQLFPAEEGLLGILNAPGNLIHPTVTWGESATSLIEHSFLADDCWALRRGRLHSVEATRPGLLCAHLPLPVPSAYVCVPDHFKAVNDTFGHEAGDVLLRQLGKLLQTHIRAGDIACRYGGEEFRLIVPDTSLETAVQRAEQLRGMPGSSPWSIKADHWGRLRSRSGSRPFRYTARTKKLFCARRMPLSTAPRPRAAIAL